MKKRCTRWERELGDVRFLAKLGIATAILLGIALLAHVSCQHAY